MNKTIKITLNVSVGSAYQEELNLPTLFEVVQNWTRTFEKANEGNRVNEFQVEIGGKNIQT